MATSGTPHIKTTLFIDKLSQPSRAVLWFCLNEQIPDFEVKYVQIRKSEQRSPEFLKINPAGKVPAINDKGFCIGESCSIVRYLHDKYGSRLIPKDLQQRARTDVAMDNYHNNLRIGAARTFWFGFMAPNIGMKVDPALQKDALGILRSSLKTLDATLSSQKYLAGDEITFVDMLVYSEIRQLDLVDYDLSQFTSLVAWMALMTKVPHHDEVFDVLVKLKEASDKRKAAAKAKQEGAKL